MRALALLFALPLVACAAQAVDRPSGEGRSAATGNRVASAPTLSFGADWSVSSTGPVTSGGKAVIHYDLARQPTCRTWYMGFPAWDIIAFYAVDGGTARSVPLTKLVGTDRQPVDATIDVPLGKNLSIWFHASDEGGCSTWDSNYGANYNFALVQDAPVIHFRSDWSNSTDGALASGQDVILDYDLARLPSCRATYNGYQTWDVVAHYRFDGGDVHDASLTSSLSDYQRVQAPARIATPAGAHSLEVWFDDHDRTGCQGWDSRYGANYSFDLR